MMLTVVWVACEMILEVELDCHLEDNSCGLYFHQNGQPIGSSLRVVALGVEKLGRERNNKHILITT
jgi:hypothetical protein